MQIKVTDDGATFRPITLEVTIETEDELLALWHRVNIGTGSFKEYFSHARIQPEPKNMSLTKLFVAIDNLWEKRRW